MARMNSTEHIQHGMHLTAVMFLRVNMSPIQLPSDQVRASQHTSHATTTCLVYIYIVLGGVFSCRIWQSAGTTFFFRFFWEYVPDSPATKPAANTGDNTHDANRARPNNTLQRQQKHFAAKSWQLVPIPPPARSGRSIGLNRSSKG